MNNQDWSITEHEEPLAINDEGLITVFCSSNRADRFLASRLGTWEETRDRNIYRYRICARKLSKALEQGFTAHQISTFLQRASNRKIPKSVLTAIEQWTNNSASAKINQITTISFDSTATLTKFLQSPQTNQYVEEQLGPLTVRIKHKNSKKIYNSMMKIGILLDSKQ
jgi:hypothetical protein